MKMEMKSSERYSDTAWTMEVQAKLTKDMTACADLTARPNANGTQWQRETMLDDDSDDILFESACCEQMWEEQWNRQWSSPADCSLCGLAAAEEDANEPLTEEVHKPAPILTNDKGSAEEKPAEETPAEETPTEETPAEETPAEEKPAEETPAEESSLPGGKASKRKSKEKCKKEKTSKPKKNRLITSLQREFKRWQQLKIPDNMCYKLMRLYLGESEYMDETGIYHMNNLSSISAQLCSKHSRKFIEMICKSGSFFFLVKPDYSKVYGFFSKLTINEKGLEEYEIRNEELEGVPLAKLRLANLRTVSRQSATTPFNYLIVSSILTNDLYPPSEETRLSGLRAGGFIPWDTKQDEMRQKALEKKKQDFGSAAEFFHEMKLTEDGKLAVIIPLQKLITRHFKLGPKETNIVLGKLVLNFLIPMFDRKPEFRTTSKGGRIRWLNAIINKNYFVNDLHHAYLLAVPDIERFHEQQAVQQQQELRLKLRSFRPISPYEWMNPTSHDRRYEDPTGRVVDLPNDAPARPSPTASWNSWEKCWKDAETDARMEDAEVENTEMEYPEAADGEEDGEEGESEDDEGESVDDEGESVDDEGDVEDDVSVNVNEGTEKRKSHWSINEQKKMTDNENKQET